MVIYVNAVRQNAIPNTQLIMSLPFLQCLMLTYSLKQSPYSIESCIWSSLTTWPPLLPPLHLPTMCPTLQSFSSIYYSRICHPLLNLSALVSCWFIFLKFSFCLCHIVHNHLSKPTSNVSSSALRSSCAFSQVGLVSILYMLFQLLASFHSIIYHSCFF